jgi:uncharacterized protein YbjT (DUF2867 family)
MSRTIFVSGATGTTSSATIQALLARGANVVAGVHSPEKAGQLEMLGATVRPFDLADGPGMTAALRGADGLYLVTPPVEQTEDMTKAMVEAAKAAGVGHIVKLSGLGVHEGASVAMIRWHFAAEQAVRASGIGCTMLRANAFMQNFHGAAQIVKTQGVYYNTYGSAPVSFIDARDIGDVAATVLTSDGHQGKNYDLTGPRGVASDEVVRLFAEAAGKPVKSFDVGGEQLAQAFTGFGMAQVMATATAEMMGHMATGSAAGVSPDVEALLGRASRDLVPWVKENAQAFR